MRRSILLSILLAIGLVFTGPAFMSDSPTDVYAQTCGGDGDTDGGDDCEDSSCIETMTWACYTVLIQDIYFSFCGPTITCS